MKKGAIEAKKNEHISAQRADRPNIAYQQRSRRNDTESPGGPYGTRPATKREIE